MSAEQLSLKERIVGAIQGFRGKISEQASEISRLKSQNSTLTHDLNAAQQDMRDVARSAGVDAAGVDTE